MDKHRSDYKKYLNGSVKFLSIFNLFDEFGVENCKIEWVEDYPCSSKRELHKREGEHQKNCDCVNKLIAGRSKRNIITIIGKKLERNKKNNTSITKNTTERRPKNIITKTKIK